MNLLQSPSDALNAISLGTILGTAIVAAMEAKAVGMVSDRSRGTYGSVAWFFIHRSAGVIGDPAYALSNAQYADIRSRISGKIKIAKQKQADIIQSDINKIIIKHKSDVARLGLPNDWLKANIIYVQQKYRTMEEWLSLVFDNPKIKSVTVFRSFGNYGVTVKILQVQSQGIVFRKEGDELYPVTYVAGDEAVPVRGDGDSIQIVTLLEAMTLKK